MMVLSHPEHGNPIMNFALPVINLAQALMLRGGTGVVAFLSSSLRNPRPRGRDGRLPQLHRGDGLEALLQVRDVN